MVTAAEGRPDYYIRTTMRDDKLTCRILIVDDDEDLCIVMKAALTRMGAVQIEHTLNEAQCHVQQFDPTILLLDNNLPDGLGVEHIQAIKRLCPGVAIILMTADTTPNLMHTALGEGAARFVAKPFSAALLKDIIYTLCPELKNAS